MAAPPVEGGPCVRGPACLMGIRHAANGRAARGAHGSGVQRAPVGGRWVARWINVTLIGFALSVRTGHAKGQTHLFGRARDPGQGGKTEYLGVPRGCRCSGLHRTAIHAQDMAGQVPLDPPAQACRMQLHICQLPMSGGDGPPPSSPGIAGAERPLRRLGGLGDEGEPPPAPALHAPQYAHAHLLCSG